MRCNMECLVTVKCRYSLCKTDDFVFSREFGRRSACEGPFDLIGGPLGAQNAFGWAFYSIFWMHKRAARVDLGPQGRGKRHPIRAQTSALRAQCYPLWNANHWFFFRKTDDSMV